MTTSRLPGERRVTRDEACRRAGLILAAARIEIAEAKRAADADPPGREARTGARRAEVAL